MYIYECINRQIVRAPAGSTAVAAKAKCFKACGARRGLDCPRSNADEIPKKKTNFAQRQVGQCPARECISYISPPRLCMCLCLRERCALLGKSSRRSPLFA